MDITVLLDHVNLIVKTLKEAPFGILINKYLGQSSVNMVRFSLLSKYGIRTKISVYGIICCMCAGNDIMCMNPVAGNELSTSL